MKPEALSCAVECIICNQSMVLYGHADYYDRSSHFKTSIYFCKDCDIFYRPVDNAIRLDHHYAASYVQKQNEPAFYDARIHLFEYLISLVKKYTNRNSNTEER